ncbi:hypothetical protein, partial [Nocardia sp. SC052]|uniref:hypothetical protein n=1 Tax=Nocardia sichangensis TaxID=3385975 RepID=UPI0039A36CA6
SSPGDFRERRHFSPQREHTAGPGAVRARTTSLQPSSTTSSITSADKPAEYSNPFGSVKDRTAA